jgi:RNA polymerase sigma factor (sigma-70 family)
MSDNISEIFKEHESCLLRYAGRLLGDMESARDIVQEAFLRLVKYEEKKSLETIENVRAWLYRTTRNLCYDTFRSAKNRLEITIETERIDRIADHASTPDANLAKEDDMQLIRKQINALEPRAREIVVLKLEHERSYKEIADIMGLTSTNVGFILHKAMQKITKGFNAKAQ